jgi:P-type Ca2+ transporter type 2C
MTTTLVPRLDGAPAAGAAVGLTSAEAHRRLEQFGPNVLAEEAGPNWAVRFGRNIVNLFALLLWAGAALAWLARTPELSVAIVGVILINAAFSFAQEHRAEQAVEALRGILPQRVRVRRDGRPQEITADGLVPGDVMLLSAGDRVSADGELAVAVELKLDMSTLTGESRPVRRYACADGGGRTGIEAPNLVFAGTYVVAGTGEALAATTGMRTELGRIAGLTQRAERRRSPLELEVDRVSKFVAVLSLSIGTGFFLVAGAIGMGITEALRVRARRDSGEPALGAAADADAGARAGHAAHGAAQCDRAPALVGGDARRDGRDLHR